jgi:hypothetical protein
LALLIDNDIVHKLAQLNLLKEAKLLLEKAYGELIVLNTLRFKYCHPTDSKKRKKAEKYYNSVVVLRIECFLNSGVTEISSVVVDSDLIIAMSLIDDLNGGEMQLLQALINQKDQFLFTGDKRFLRGLVQAKNLEEKLNNVTEHFICFEQIIIYLIKCLTFEIINEKFIKAKDEQLPCFDSSLRVTFGSQRELTEQSYVIENLTREINILRKDTGNLLATANIFYEYNSNVDLIIPY